MEAAPGSGKTTVSAQRFGLHRFASAVDHRAVVAISFTRSATEEMRSRVLRHWGPSALAWPHRVVTLDTVLYGLLAHLLQIGVLQWPEGHRELEVLDTWRTTLPTTSTRRKPILSLEGTRIVPSTVWAPEHGSQATLDDFTIAVRQGKCTHDNVREVLQLALPVEGVGVTLSNFFDTTIRSLIVDEIYDANDLDLEVIRLAASGGLNVTLVGDPWQALYGFRGARPREMRRLIKEHGFTSRPLQASFRWRSSVQGTLALRLRERQRAVLPPGTVHDVDVVLARHWKTLWDADPHVLPLAIKPRAGQLQEAVCTLLLNEVTQRAFDMHAAFLNDALTTLGIKDGDSLAALRPRLRSTVDQLAGPSNPRHVWQSLSQALLDELPTRPPGNGERTPLAGLKGLQARLQVTRPLVPGLTCHQAKGREWDKVGVKLEETDAGALASGLDPREEDHRSLYVALTRARRVTLAV